MVGQCTIFDIPSIIMRIVAIIGVVLGVIIVVIVVGL